MQTVAGQQDTQTLISKPNLERKWSTSQLITIVLIAMIVVGIASNMDRIVDSVSSNSNTNDSSFNFGHSAKKKFALDDDYTEFNFGAYGNAPLDVMEYQQKIRLEIEACPTCWFRRNRVPSLNELLQRLAEYLGVEDWEDLAFIINASHGMNAVLRSITRTLYNDKCRSNVTTCKVLQFNTAYGMVKRTIEYINNDPASDNDQMIQFDVTTEMFSNTDLLLQELEIFIEETLNKANHTIYLASVSEIASMPSVLYDVKRITELFHSYNIITLIDAAHVIGAINVNISDMDPDIWLANGHKWLYSTRGSAVIYVKKELQDIIYPAVISSEYTSSFQRKFNYQGTMDDSIWMSMHAALDFRNKFGEQEVIDYLHNICMEGAEILNKIWNTTLLIYNEENIGSMINPILPTQNATEVSVVMSTLEYEYYTLIPVTVFEDVHFIRLSCQIYHQASDFEWLGNTVLDILNKLN